MANGHVEIHDLISNHRDLRRSEEDDDTEDMDGTPEFRLLMAYATRRRGNKESPGQNGNGTPSPSTPLVGTETMEDEKPKQKKKKKKKKKKVWKRLFSCIHPQTLDKEPEAASNPDPDPLNRCFTEIAPEENQDFDKAAKCLTRIADDIPFLPRDLETDSPNDDVERMVGLLLRDAGDKLNERELKDLQLVKGLFWNYSFYKAIMSTLLSRMGFSTLDPDSPGPRASPEAKIAVACEATTRLSAMETLPVDQMCRYGAKYLKENHSSWAQEHGGYEAAFEYDEDECD